MEQNVELLTLFTAPFREYENKMVTQCLCVAKNQKRIQR